MRVLVNDEAHDVPPGTTVAGLVELLGSGRRGVAVALGAEVVLRSTWESVELTEGDRVEILRAVQGGCDR